MNTCFLAHDDILRVAGHLEGRAWLVKVTHGGWSGGLKVISAFGIIIALSAFCSAPWERKCPLPWSSKFYHPVFPTVMDGDSQDPCANKVNLHPLGWFCQVFWPVLKTKPKTTTTRKTRAEEITSLSK